MKYHNGQRDIYVFVDRAIDRSIIFEIPLLNRVWYLIMGNRIDRSIVFEIPIKSRQALVTVPVYDPTYDKYSQGNQITVLMKF